MQGRRKIGTVLVIDDDAAVRRSLSRLLRSADYDVYDYGSVSEFRQAELPNEPVCILLDLYMPHETGLDLQSELVTRAYHPPIVFLSGHADVNSSVTAMRNGAVDFLEKPIDDILLLKTIDQAIRNDIETRTAQRRDAELRKRVAALTPREHEVLTHVISGRLNKQIAFNLGISEKTVKVHRGRMMEKLNVHSVAALTRLCEEAGVEPVLLEQRVSV